MSKQRLVNKDKLIAFIKSNGFVCANALETFPEVDAIPTPVRCKECRWWTRNKDFNTQFGRCGRFNATTAKDGYCSAGRESEEA